MTLGFTAWPSDSPLGGGGFVDLSGERNPPVESKPTAVDPAPAPAPAAPSFPTLADWVKRMGSVPSPGKLTQWTREEYERFAQRNRPPLYPVMVTSAELACLAPGSAIEIRPDAHGRLSKTVVSVEAIISRSQYDPYTDTFVISEPRIPQPLRLCDLRGKPQSVHEATMESANKFITDIAVQMMMAGEVKRMADDYAAAYTGKQGAIANTDDDSA